MQSLISIIVPVYNAEKHLSQCVESILAQTLTNIELILVNDGSADASPEICKHYAKLDNRIRVIHQKNLGPSAARNKGLAIAQGKYIGFVDADDYIACDMYETLLTDLISHDACMAKTNFTKTTSSGEVVTKRETGKCHLWVSQKAIYSFLVRDITISIWNGLYSRELTDGFRFNEDAFFGEDLDFTYAMLAASTKMCFRDECKYFYRMHESSLTKSGFNERSLHLIPILSHIICDIKMRFPDLTKEADAFSFYRKICTARRMHFHHEDYIKYRDHKECQSLLQDIFNTPSTTRFQAGAAVMLESWMMQFIPRLYVTSLEFFDKIRFT